jgi:hypothetical protein
VRIVEKCNVPAGHNIPYGINKSLVFLLFTGDIVDFYLSIIGAAEIVELPIVEIGLVTSSQFTNDLEAILAQPLKPSVI